MCMTQRSFLLGGFAVALAAALLFLFPNLLSGVNEAQVQALVLQSGGWGPVLIIVLMCAAVVFSPIPSAPIALAAGAAYGHTLGTLWVVIGAEAGALLAFTLSRWLGREAIRRWLGASADRLTGSQNVLMWLVFVSRLMPFVSFDMVSYAAGLSALTFARFAIATLAGILPASFLLAHLGGELAGGQPGYAVWLVAGLGLVTGLPLLVAFWRKRAA